MRRALVVMACFEVESQSQCCGDPLRKAPFGWALFHASFMAFDRNCHLRGAFHAGGFGEFGKREACGAAGHMQGEVAATVPVPVSKVKPPFASRRVCNSAMAGGFN